ncbi:hypothetical protein [Erythrobacter alti]|uniref:hypothetical protein n=1 Tax=Erythrobacter alti TaxID=1896145 RepID=UPI0030F41428
MATTKQASGKKATRLLKILLLVLLLLAGIGWIFRAPISGYGELATAHAARNVCACRFVAGQSESVCEQNFVLGTPPVLLGEDEEERSVTAQFPPFASNTATYRDGYGCVLEPWDR